MEKPAHFAFPRPRLVFSFLANANEGKWKKLVLLAAVIYVLFPIDAVPDLIPLWGWLDDLGVTTLALAFLSWAVAPYADPSYAAARTATARTATARTAAAPTTSAASARPTTRKA